jgi:hypothetical protein
MNELIESDEELNAADIEDIGGPGLHSSDEDVGLDGQEDEYDYDSDEKSLVDSEEERD